MPSTTTAPETDPSKTVVEEITGWLRLYSDGTVERLTPPGAEPFTVTVPPYTEPRNGVTVHDSIVGSLPQLLRASLTTKLDVAGIVSVFLPLAPEHRLPAAIDAGHAALLWLRDVACGEDENNNGAAHHLDPAVERLRDEADFARVFLIGDSSGGNLVHLVAAHAAAKDDGAGADLHPVRLAGGVLLNPGFAREDKSRSELENPPSLFLTEEMVDKLLALGVPLGMNKDSPYTSPSLAAEAVARLHMPPMLLMVAEKDLLHDPQVEYGEAMARVGKTVETVVSRGAVAHVFYLNFFAVESDPLTAERTRELIDTIKTFIDRY
uniref:Alpha/beta hydrolase fold-3 domain-containing protein n=1 Tax=Oryza rufipogon TaxID=4529 RepID=A0A0E0RDG5_ORYRU